MSKREKKFNKKANKIVMRHCPEEVHAEMFRNLVVLMTTATTLEENEREIVLHTVESIARYLADVELTDDELILARAALASVQVLDMHESLD